MERMVKATMEILTTERRSSGGDTPLVKTEIGVYDLNGVNVLRLPSRDAGTF